MMRRRARAPAVEVAVPEQPEPGPVLDIKNEIATLKGMISEGHLKDALINVYAAARRIARYYGNEVTDSSTHREFYRDIAINYASASQPLSAIVNTYESVNFGRGEVNSNEVAATVDDLCDLYQAMGSQKEEEPLP
jgi:hypothetical protein